MPRINYLYAALRVPISEQRSAAYKSQSYRSVSAVAVRAAVLLLLLVGPTMDAQSPLPLYTDHLVNAFQDWSWGAHNLANSSPVHSGSSSISMTLSAWQALSLYHPGFNSTPYANLSFWANGGSSGGQVLQVSAHVNGVDQPPYVLAALPANTWKQYTLSLASLRADNKTNLDRITIQLTASGSATTFYIDDIQLTAKPAPALVHLSLNATQAIRSVDPRWFGVNAAVWDGNFDTSRTASLLGDMGTRILRFPGGSLSDDYHWASNKTGTNTWQWPTSFAKFAHIATNLGAQAFITVNYGSGTAAEAAGWVRSSNLTNHYGFKYWEIGNECYGTWENDTNTYPHDAYTYAIRAKDYLQQMKAADPSIKVGMVATPGETSYDNGYTTHPAYNPRTGQTNYGWTPVLLSTLKTLGVAPDFLIHHRYPEYTGSPGPACQDSDPLLLQSSAAWATDAADLRQQISDYFSPVGTNIELVCTENNSDAGAQGKQSTSLVNGLYLADSLGQLMKTEFNSLVWWDLRNGTDANGSFDATLYGWRSYGDLGLINGLKTLHPTYYAAKLMKDLAQPGDSILNVASDYLLLSAYSAHRTNGALTLLVINRDTLTNFNAQITIQGFTPSAGATIESYGIPQDSAAQTGLGWQDILRTNFVGAAGIFTNDFPPLSLTLFSFAPSAPRLAILPSAPQPNAPFVIQLEGQVGVPYVLQTSTDLTVWTSISTNVLSGSILNFTNVVPSSQSANFWRALWQP